MTSAIATASESEPLIPARLMSVETLAGGSAWEPPELNATAERCIFFTPIKETHDASCNSLVAGMLITSDQVHAGDSITMNKTRF